jgi:hypothetical protein
MKASKERAQDSLESVSLQKESSSGGIAQSCTQSASVHQGRG